MHCPDEFAACVERMNEIRATDPSRYSEIMFTLGLATASEYIAITTAVPTIEVDA